MALSARRKLVHYQEDQTLTPVNLKTCQDVGAVGKNIPRRYSRAAGHTTRLSIKCDSNYAATKMPFAAISLGGVLTNSPAESDSIQRRSPQVQFVTAGRKKEEPTASDPQQPAWRGIVANLASGATAGCAVEAALYPIDTVKTRLQMATTGGGVRALFKAGGGKALYSGLWGNLFGVAPATAVFFAVYEPVKQAVLRNSSSDKRHVLAPIVAGSTSGLVASLIRVPTEVVKQRMQSGEFISATRAVQGIVSREGLKGLFAGYGSFLLRDLPFDAIEFVSYEQMKRAYGATLGGKREINPAETAAMGAAAGAVTGILTTPFDVLKTRLMTQGTSGTYKNVGDCAAKIWRQEGWKTFFKGWEPRVLWISIGGCVFFSALEASKTFYHKNLGLPPPPKMH